MPAPIRPRTRRAVLAARGAERAELQRRTTATAVVDTLAARARVIEHLREAKITALEARMVAVAGEIAGLLRRLEADR